MNFEMNGEEYLNGVRNFIKVYYKEELKRGTLKKTIKTYVICLIILFALLLIMPGLSDLIMLVVYFILIVSGLMASVIGISILIAKKKTLKNNIVKVEQTYDDKIIVKAYMENGSVDEAQYNYKDVKKVVETREFFYLFLNDNLAFPLKKYNNRNEFIEYIQNKNIIVWEMK